MARCKTGKRVFYSQLDAKIALMNTRHKDRDEQRMYRCEFCGKWHLTSQERKVER